MTTYADYQQQIAKAQAQIDELKKKAEEARAAEAIINVRAIAEMMAAKGVNIKDLSKFLTTQKAKKKEPAKVKFRDPETGQTWTGNGQAPKWIKGKDREQFAV